MTAAPSIVRPGRGFTLIEVLLAVAVFSIVLVAIHLVFYGAIRLRNKTTAAFDAALPLQQTLAILKRDLANIVLPGGALSGELQTTPTATSTTSSGTQQGLLGSGLTGPNVGTILQGQASPAFQTSVGIIADNAPWGEVAKVYYYLADPTNQTVGRDLFRSVTRNLLPTLQAQPTDQWLMSGVQSIFFSFYDGTQWLNTWDSTTATTKLPLAIKVQLQLVPDETQRTPLPPLEVVVPIMVQAGTNQTTQASGGQQ